MSLHHALSAALRQEPNSAAALAAWPVDDVVRLCLEQGVSGLVRRRIALEMPASELAAALDRQVRLEALQDEWDRQRSARVIASLGAAGIDAIVFKGAAVAQTLYPATYLRPRLDIDLLVRRSAFGRAGAVLESIGYAPATMVAREAVHAERAYEEAIGRMRHTVDLHWAVSSRPVFGALCAFDELAEDLRPLPSLGPTARTTGPVWSLLVACIHLVSHHPGSRRLIWLSDVDALAASLTPMEWSRFVSVARDRRVAMVCRAVLTWAAEALGAAPTHRARIDQLVSAAAVHEPSAAYLDEGRSTVGHVLLDLHAARGFREKGRLLAGHLFPDAAYMRRAFGAESAPALASAYARRLVVGVRRAWIVR